MSIDDFNKYAFTGGMTASFKGDIYDIGSVDFDQCLIGLDDPANRDELRWGRCENVDVIS